MDAQSTVGDLHAIRIAVEAIEAQAKIWNATAARAADALDKISLDIHLIQLSFTGRPADLDIVVEPAPPKSSKGNAMSKKGTGTPIKCQMKPKGAAPVKGMVMPPQSLTSAPQSILLQPVDGATPPNPVTVVSPPDVVAGTLASDSASFVVVAGADTLHYTATIPANTPLGTVVNLSATLVGTIQGAPANFTASIQLTLNIPPVPVAVDVEIILG